MSKTKTTVNTNNNENYVDKISKGIHSHTPSLIKEIIFYSLIFGLLYLFIYIYNNTLFIKYIKYGHYEKAFFEIHNLLFNYGLIALACVFVYLIITKELNKFINLFATYVDSIVLVIFVISSIIIITYIIIFNITSTHNYYQMKNFLESNIEIHFPLFKNYCPFANKPNTDTETFLKFSHGGGSDEESENDIIENFEGDNDDGDDDMLKYISNNCPPIQVFNNELGEYQDLVLSDFYYSGCYNSLVYGIGKTSFLRLENLNQLLLPANSPINGFNMRMLHFKIDFDENSIPMIVDGTTNKSNIDFYTCMKKINGLAWRQPYSKMCVLPLFLYFEFVRSDFTMFEYVHNTLTEIFGKRFIDKKHGYSGRNNHFPAALAPIKECFGKIILLSNKYPTMTNFDEIINVSTNDDSQCKTIEYTKEFHSFDTGVSTNNNKKDLVIRCRSSFVMVIPKITEDKQINLVNPNIEDCYSYGIQFVLTNPYYNYGTDGLNNKSNMNILKDFSNKYNSVLLKNKEFRYYKDKVPKVSKIYSIYKPNNIKTIPIIPGFSYPTVKGGFQ